MQGINKKEYTSPFNPTQPKFSEVQQTVPTKPTFPTPPSIIYDQKRNKKYIRGRVLGEGGFARCYEVTENLAGNQTASYAAKVIPKSSLRSEKQKAKLYGEIHIHRKMDHHHVVKWYEVFEDTDFVYMTLELCEGKTFVEMLKKRKRLTEPEVRYFMFQLLDAVRYMHENKVIHRDLKLGNIFLTKDLKVKIGDFGLAATIKKDGERKRTICGTPNYIAPEVLFDTRNGHSYEVDIWSLGVIMYTLLVGKPPFQTKDVKAIYKKIKENNYEYPPHIQLSDDAISLIKSLLHTRPECRPMAVNIMRHKFFRSYNIITSIPMSALYCEPQFTEEEEGIKSDFKRVEVEKTTQFLAKVASATQLSEQQDDFQKTDLDYQPNNHLQNIKHTDNDLVKRTSLLRIQQSSHGRSPIPELWTKQSVGNNVTRQLKPSPLNPKLVNYVGNHISLPNGNLDPGTASEPESRESNFSPQLLRPKNGYVYDSKVTDGFLPKQTEMSSKPMTIPPAGDCKEDRKLESKENDLPVNYNPHRPNFSNKLSVVKEKKEITSIVNRNSTQAMELMLKNLTTALDDCQKNKEGINSKLEHNICLFETPELFITKWIDYCAKYGLGYQLRNGNVGVYFNDATSIILASDNLHFEYIYNEKVDPRLKKLAKEKSGGENVGSKIIRRSHTMDNYPSELSKKVTLLYHFKKYLKDSLTNNNKLNEAEPRNAEEELVEEKTQNLAFLTKYVRSKFGVIFRLSDHTLQFNLFDHTKLIFTMNGLRVSYINKKREMITVPLQYALSKTGELEKEIADRTKCCREILKQMIAKRMVTQEKDS
ncbi:Cell cycle serine/threonine-protein kinase cdc5/MSD2 [Clydaea vesicula]|uniref:Serine/threonine-protein kinase n=1 Tax=Clydaea vesicula TaxID=447962 RepID=A0AAD5U6Z7_9FUNG|nr:Cell cycle serine/threonine-protein kinase cdc5/MSD2 [Clydaea vesicula]